MERGDGGRVRNKNIEEVQSTLRRQEGEMDEEQDG